MNEDLRLGLAAVAVSVVRCVSFTVAYVALVYGFGLDSVLAAGGAVVWALSGVGARP